MDLLASRIQRLFSSALLGAVLVCALLTGSSSAKQPAEVNFWVSPHGSDSANGSRKNPFRTLTRARTQVRRELADQRSDIVVNLLGGTYRLTKPLSFSAKDSGRGGNTVIYRAAPGERPVISGARRVRGWTLFDASRGIYSASVPKGTQSRQMYVGGRRALRARGSSYPNGIFRTETGFYDTSGTMASWRNQSGIEAVTATQWKMMRCPVASIEGSAITMQQPCWTNVNVFPSLWSFQTVLRFENAYELLDEPGEWYLDSAAGQVFYIPRVGEDLSSADVELPVAGALVDGQGSSSKPISNIAFRGLTFAYATWMTPSGPNGYAADQSGFHLVGAGHEPNLIGHDQNVVRTPGNVRFKYAQSISFVGNDFKHLGGVGLDFATGSQKNSIVGNRFQDISAAGVQLGGVDVVDHHPTLPSQVTRDNRISNNLITRVGREYSDAPGVYIGFTTHSIVDHNDISKVPWAGIAIGWGWGLVDPGGFLGLPNAVPGQWGNYTTPTTSRRNRILNNRIRHFLEVLWDGGAIYTQGRQGVDAAGGELIAGNVASSKRRLAGGNTFYTDGGSRYVTLQGNVSYSNKPGVTDFGPCGLDDSLLICWLELPYGTDRGGCRPYGDLIYRANLWQYADPFWSACPYEGHPVNVTDEGNTEISGSSNVSRRILDAAGRQGKFKKAIGAAVGAR